MSNTEHNPFNPEDMAKVVETATILSLERESIDNKFTYFMAVTILLSVAFGITVSASAPILVEFTREYLSKIWFAWIASIVGFLWIIWSSKARGKLEEIKKRGYHILKYGKNFWVIHEPTQKAHYVSLDESSGTKK